MMTTLRRNESFELTLLDGAGLGNVTIFVPPSIRFTSHVYGSRPLAIDRDTVEKMILHAGSTIGLEIGSRAILAAEPKRAYDSDAAPELASSKAARGCACVPRTGYIGRAQPADSFRMRLILASISTVGIEVTFGGDTPVRLPICALIAAAFLSPIVWSAAFRSRRYGLTPTEDALIVESWWRKRTFERAELSAAEPLPGVMRMRDGYFSGRGSNAEPFAVWRWPSGPKQDEFPLGGTTGTWQATSVAARKINAWLGVEVDFDEGRANALLDED